MEGLDEKTFGFELTWRVAEGESLTKIRQELHKSYGYVEHLVLQHISREQLNDIIYFQRHREWGSNIKQRVDTKEAKAIFLDNWKATHKPHKAI